MSELCMNQIRSLPKVDLHRHLDCSMRFSTMLEIAKTIKLEIPKTSSKLRDFLLITQPMDDLNSVLVRFLNAQKFFTSAEIIERLAFEVCEDAFNDGVSVLELRYAPSFMSEGPSGLNFEQNLEALVKGITRAEKKYPMAVGLISILQRTKDLKTAQFVTEFTLANRQHFVALDLADEEQNFVPENYRKFFEEAQHAGLHVTIHAGETPKENSSRDVQDAIEILSAERIGHGVQIAKDLKILDLVRSKGITLEVCPISNSLTRAFPSPQEHSARQLLNAGVKIAICSDDPGMFGSTLSDDYELLQRTQGFTIEDFRRCGQIAAQASFIPKSKIETVWKFS